MAKLTDGSVRIRHLIFVTAVAEHGSLSKAAAALNVTQPHVSRSIQELENAVKIKLFERESHGVVVTDAGREFINYATAVLNTMEQAETHMKQLAMGEGPAIVRVGVNLATVHSLLPKAIVDFKNQVMNTSISLIEEYQGALELMMARNEIDMIVSRIPTERDEGNQYLSLYEDPLVMVVNKNHPALNENIELSKLINLPWILPGYTSVFRNEIDAFFLLHGLPLPKDLIESSTIVATRPLLLDTHSVAVLPKSLVRGDSELRVLSLLIGTVPTQIGITIRKGSVQSEHKRKFISCIIEAAKTNI